MYTNLLFCMFISSSILLGCQTSAQSHKATATTKPVDRAAVIADHAKLVHQSYADAYEAALKLQKAVDGFLAEPNAKSHQVAKSAWLTARDPYSLTEAFRYYEGPIDAEGGPESQLNAWPLNEAYIDYVQGNDKAGIISDRNITLDAATLAGKNAKDDEADVTTGYHAIEFLLWGQDLSLDSAGNRPASDFDKGDPIRDRRRAYLKIVTDLVVTDLKTLVDAWAPSNKDNYAAAFAKLDSKVALSNVFTGLASLCGFELASERIAVSLDSGSQENEQSCFSDNTHRDLIANCQGIANVYLGQLGTWRGKGLNLLVDAADPALNKKIESQLQTTQTLVNALDIPIDRVLASPKGSDSRKKMEALVKSLQIQAELFKQVGEKLGLEVAVKAE